MSVKIRLARAGAKKAPFYRLVAADSRAPRDGRFIEILGRYNPRTHPSTIEIDLEKVDAWIAKGAQSTETAAKLIAIARDPEAKAPERVKGLSKKAQARLADDAKKAADDAKKAADAAAAAEAAAAESVEEVVEEPAAEEPVEEVVEEAAAEEAPAEEPVVEDAAADEEPVEEATAE